MRDNNKYYALYEQELETAGITPEMELDDILELIKGKNGWYDTFREKLKTFAEHMRTGDPVKDGKRKIAFQDFATDVVCMPAARLSRIESLRPWKFEPRPDGTQSVRYDLTDDEREECGLLHWIYIEMETIDSRLRAQRA